MVLGSLREVIDGLPLGDHSAGLCGKEREDPQVAVGVGGGGGVAGEAEHPEGLVGDPQERGAERTLHLGALGDPLLCQERVVAGVSIDENRLAGGGDAPGDPVAHEHGHGVGHIGGQAHGGHHAQDIGAALAQEDRAGVGIHRGSHPLGDLLEHAPHVGLGCRAPELVECRKLALAALQLDVALNRKARGDLSARPHDHRRAFSLEFCHGALSGSFGRFPLRMEGWPP